MAFSRTKYNQSSNHQKSYVYNSCDANEQSESEEQDCKQSMLQQYKQFLGKALEDIKQFKIEDIPYQTLVHHRIKIIDEKDKIWQQMVYNGHAYVQFIKSKFYGLQCLYQVLIGRFYMIVSVLNINCKSQFSGKKNQKDQNDSMLGKGSFGIVKIANISGIKIALKHLKFNKNKKHQISIPGLIDPNDSCTPYMLRQAIKQYSIYKICSMLKIGPQVIFNNVYDLICFNDGIQFQMQLCEKVQQCVGENYGQDLKNCVAKLHTIKFVHKDIKPDNTLYSPSLGRYVLGDFGIAQSVKQNLGQKTQTYFQGTQGYMSKQMKELCHTNKPGFVDLYYNDIHALMKTFQNVEVQKKYQSNSSQYVDSSKYQHHQFSYIQRQSSGMSESNSYSTIKQSQQQNFKYQSLQQYPSSLTSFSQIQEAGNQLNIMQTFYYVMKIIYNLLTEDKNKKQAFDQIIQNQQKGSALISSTASKVCSYIINSQMFQKIKKIVKSIFQPQNRQIYAIITSFKNTLRTFGFFSQQFISKLKNIQKEKSLNFVNYQQLKQQINYLQNNLQKKYLKKYQTAALDLTKHFLLVNDQKFIKQLRYVFRLKNRALREIDTAQKKIYIIGLLRLIYRNQIQNQQISQAYQLLDQMIPVKSNPQSYKSHNYLINTIKDLPKEPKFSMYIKNSKQKYKLVKFIHQKSKNQQFYGVGVQYQIFICLFKLKVLQLALQTLMPKLQKLYIKIEQAYFYKIQNPWPKSNHQQITRLYLESLRFHVYIFFLNNLANVASQIALRNLDHIKTRQNSLYKIMLVDVFFRVFMKVQKYDLAEQCNQLSYKEMIEYYFPKEDYCRIALYNKNKGLILFKNNRILQAIQILKKAQYLVTQNMYQYYQRNNDDCRLQTYSTLLQCYNQLKDYQKMQQYWRRTVKYCSSHNQTQIQKKLSYYGNFIKTQIKRNKTAELKNLFDTFLSLKMIFCEGYDTSEFCLRIFRQVKAFMLQQQEQSPQITKQTIVKVKRILVQSIEKYLPIFLNYYRKLSEEIAYYYINTLNMRLKALPYLWNYFRKFPLYQIPEDQFFYVKVDRFVTLLMQSNSNRKALKFLQKYIYKIPEQFYKLRQSGFKKLNYLSKTLGQKRYIYYNYIYKYQAYQNEANLQQCHKALANLNQVDLAYPIKHAFLRKLFALRLYYNKRQQNILWQPEQFDGKLTNLEFQQLIKQKRLLKLKQKQIKLNC